MLEEYEKSDGETFERVYWDAIDIIGEQRGMEIAVELGLACIKDI